MGFKVRATGILLEDNKILLVRQKVDDSRNWSLPRGTQEFGETLEECMIREMKEETGLIVEIEKLLYVCDRIKEKNHVVHVTFKLRKTGGIVILGYEPEAFANPITDVKMVPIAALNCYGFSECFCKLVKSDFPNSGKYMGLVKNIGL